MRKSGTEGTRGKKKVAGHMQGPLKTRARNLNNRKKRLENGLTYGSRNRS